MICWIRVLYMDPFLFTIWIGKTCFIVLRTIGVWYLWQFQFILYSDIVCYAFFIFSRTHWLLQYGDIAGKLSYSIQIVLSILFWISSSGWYLTAIFVTQLLQVIAIHRYIQICPTISAHMSTPPISKLSVHVPHEFPAHQTEMCSICLDPLTLQHIQTSCGHHFHQKCIDTWYQSKQYYLCPICRGTTYQQRIIIQMVLESSD